jgi:tRNA dimethylallyltransferase
LIVLTGPTAVGKSVLALKLAEKFNGEIISADSRTLYRKMNIATAKPSPEELAHIPHYLIDVVSPDEDFTLSDFQTQAYTLIDNLLAQGKLPLVVGGTLLYINALVQGWQIPKVAPDLELRRALEEEAAGRGPEALYEELKQLDPEAAARIIPNNTRRIIRALEVYRTTGKLFSEAQGKNPPPYRILKLGLTLERETLYKRADKRIEKMFEHGLIDEVKGLLAEGYSPDLPSMTSLGYSHVIAYLRGEMTLDEAKERMKFATHRYIRQQYTWFRRDPEIIWLDAADPLLEEKASQEIQKFLADDQ